jgi:16S rRNA C1402 N4-methylase RsmH
MSQDRVTAAEGVAVDKDPQVEQHAQARTVSLRDDLKAAKQRVTDAQKALKALEKEAQDAK